MHFNKSASRAVNVLIYFVFGLSLFVFITVIFNRDSGVPSFYGFSFLSVSTPSMEPTYPVDSILIIQKTDVNELAAGDVISFYSNDPAIYGQPNTHRIESKGIDGENKLFFITKGDNNIFADRYRVYEDKIIGKVRSSIPTAGKLLGKINNRYALFYLLIVPLIIVVFFEIRHIKKLFQTKDTEVAQPCISSESDSHDGSDDNPDKPEQALLDKINKIQAEIDRLNSTAGNTDNKE